MKPKYEREQVVVYWNGELGVGSSYDVEYVNEILQKENECLYKLRGTDRWIYEENLYETINDVKVAIKKKAQAFLDLLIHNCEKLHTEAAERIRVKDEGN